MSGKAISPEAQDRLGVYKRLEDVPDRYRLEQYEASYAGRDVWREYVSARTETYDTDSFKKRVTRAGEHWREFMELRERHPALATPEHVAAWATAVSVCRKPRTAYETYWAHVEGFYNWLKNHTEHPHVYNPVLMAVANDPNKAIRAIWQKKMGWDSE